MPFLAVAVVVCALIAVAVWDGKSMIRIGRSSVVDAAAVRTWKLRATLLWSLVFDAIPFGLWLLGSKGVIVFHADDWQQRAVLVAILAVLVTPFVFWNAHSIALSMMGVDEATAAD